MIKYFDVNSIDAFGSHPSQTVLRGTNGARMGISLVASESYSKEESHDDQEGLFFVEGTGYAKFDGVEYPICPGTYVLMPAYTKHCFRKDPDSCIVRLLWFHSAV
ncbi:MAG: cupin domain-containing protein [Clostridiales bacterium]|nr:cupin domain-containing protein [Clostridiales bacterium]